MKQMCLFVFTTQHTQIREEMPASGLLPRCQLPWLELESTGQEMSLGEPVSPSCGFYRQQIPANFRESRDQGQALSPTPAPLQQLPW